MTKCGILYDIIVARSLNRGIGKNGGMIWNLPSELKMFKKITTSCLTGNTVIMGKNTFQSIRRRPLPNRTNIIVSSTLKLQNSYNQSDQVYQVSSLHEALNLAVNLNPQTQIFVIGGQKLYAQALPNCRYVYQTLINQKFQSDAFFPQYSKLETSFVSKTQVQKQLTFDFRIHYNPVVTNGQNIQNKYGVQRHEQYQYLEAIKNIIDKGEQKIDRTKTGTKSIFGGMMKYDLRNTFPLLTHKKVFWRGVAQQLLWFVKGSTNAKQLQQKKIRIWDGNSSKQYLQSIGINNRQAGDIGPVYGFQWRHWNAPYTTMHQNYQGKGFDQLKWIIQEIKRNPNSRRLIMSAWNPQQMSQMALPPCHLLSHFYVTNDRRLSCILYQRSCDMGLGVPFNIASYSLLTCMMAQVCGLQRGQFIHMLGDMHVYSDHIPSLKNAHKIVPYPFPTLYLNPEINDIDGFKFEHFNLKGYNSHKKIEMKMSI